MELSPTTFILEIINFLVLVWILKRLFFAPVKRALKERRALVAKTVDDARKLKAEAEALRLQYEGRMKDWESEKAKARHELDTGLGEERARRLGELAASLESEKQKARVQDERKARIERERIEREAIAQSRQFSARLLESVASPELEARLIELALGRLEDAKLGLPDGAKSVCGVRTAFDIPEALRSRIEAAFGAGAEVRFSRDPSLLAGVEIQCGATVVRANLRDELSFFGESGT